MKVCLFFLFVFLFNANAHTFSQETNISLRMRNSTIKEILSAIEKKTDYIFILSDNTETEMNKIINVDVSSKTVNEMLKIVTEKTELKYNIFNRQVVVYTENGKPSPVSTKQPPQSAEFKGQVVDIRGEPLMGVTVKVKNTTQGTSTDYDGNFSIILSTQESEMPLVFSCIGFKTQEGTLKKGTAMKIILLEDIAEIGEVVVTGIFNRKKESFTGSSVKMQGEDIKKVSPTNIAKSLSTIDPSFRVMENSLVGSNPNSLPELRLRGQANLPAGTTGLGENLISLQGEYATYPNQPLLIMDGFEISLQTLQDLDPDRVESITILKDAAATAIYGSRAANGVIVIETKLPEAGKLRVSYGCNVRVETPDLTGYNLMNAEEKLHAEKEAGFYPENYSIDLLRTYQHYLREVKRGVNTYWLSKPLRTSVQQRHSLSFEGGDQALRYKLYGGANFSPGVMKGSERRTYTGSLDLSYRFEKLLLRNIVTVDNNIGDNSPYGSFSQYTRLNPYLRPFEEDGSVNRIMQITELGFLGQSTYSIPNPLYNSTLNTMDKTSTFGVTNLFKIQYDPIEALRITLDFNLTKNVGKTEIFRPAQHTAFINQFDPTLKGDFKRNQSERFNYAADLTASYNKSIKNTHFFTANTRYSVQEQTDETFGALVTGFPNQHMNSILFGNRYYERLFGNEATTRSIGWIGTVGYSYDFRYSLDFNIRIDGSSQFGSQNRFAPFWSTGFRWDMLKERFLKNSFFDQLVFRATYGVTGAQGFSPYQSMSLYTYGGLLRPYLASDATGAALVAMGNENLKWQQTDQMNFGLEMGILDNRITARAELFKKITKNMVANITLAPSLGFPTYPENLGQINNEGIELSLSFIPYRNMAKQAFWILNVNAAHTTNKLSKLSDALRKVNERNALTMQQRLSEIDPNAPDFEERKRNLGVPLPRYEEGYSLSQIWVVKSLGIDPATGKEIYQNRLTGEMMDKYRVEDMIPYGDSEPKWQGNINSSMNYEGFSLNMNFWFKYGGQIYNSTLVQKVENADLLYNADKRVLDLRWSPENRFARYKALTNSRFGADTQATSRFVMNENVLSLGSVSFGYRLDQSSKIKDSLGKVGIKSLKTDLVFEDVFYWSTVKRERGLDYPFSKRLSLSLNIVF